MKHSSHSNFNVFTNQHYSIHQHIYHFDKNSKRRQHVHFIQIKLKEYKNITSIGISTFTRP